MNKKDFGKILDEKLKAVITNLEEIGARVKTVEDGMLTHVDGMRLRNELSRLEKRLTGVEGKMLKMKKNMTTKKDLEKIHEKLDFFFEALDKDISQHKRRIINLEQVVDIKYETAQI